jgi:hypothetical protein
MDGVMPIPFPPHERLESFYQTNNSNNNISSSNHAQPLEHPKNPVSRLEGGGGNNVMLPKVASRNAPSKGK